MSKITIDLVKLIEQVSSGDNSELRIQALNTQGSADGLSFDAYYGLLPAISNIQAYRAL